VQAKWTANSKAADAFSGIYIVLQLKSFHQRDHASDKQTVLLGLQNIQISFKLVIGGINFASTNPKRFRNVSGINSNIALPPRKNGFCDF